MKTNQLFAFLIFVLLFETNVKSQDFISLAGTWQFAVDSLDVGITNKWAGSQFSGTIKLPGSTDEIGLGNRFPLFKSALGDNRLDGYPANADFGMLTRKHKYIGVAWYQREVNIPASKSDENYFLNLERVMWRSSVWVDGKPIGEPIDFLSSPHVHDLGVLSAGKHLITIRIDNRQIHPIGTLAHSYCPHMQTQWNGVVGKIELISTPLVSINNVDGYTSFKNKSIEVRVNVNNHAGQLQKGNIKILLKEQKTGKLLASIQKEFKVEAGLSDIEGTVSIDKPVLPWNEFTPNLYELETVLAINNQLQKKSINIGFRDLGVADKHFTINGQKLVYRNSHEGLFFGKTGYPAMDVGYWTNVFNVYKSHGLNAVRFHSGCPPEAAFIAADQLGIYLQVEFFWMDGWMGYKNLIGGKDEQLNQFVQSELTQALKAYGNHPSMMLLAIGNELGGDFNKMGEWISEAKKSDSRHLYAAGIAHNVTTADDYVEYGGRASVLTTPGTDWNYSNHYFTPSAHNYDKDFLRKDLPEFTHEVGQYVVHPVWSEIAKYDGVLSPDNLVYFRKQAEKNGLEKLDEKFQKASGNIARILYKAEIEATLRASESAGYSLLSMVDYPGQGEALIGWVDPMYENKNFLSPGDFRKYGNHTVPLLKFSRFVWEDEEHFQGKVEVSNYGSAPIKQAVLHYTIKSGNEILKEGNFQATDINQGGLTSIGELNFITKSGIAGKRVSISLSIGGTEYSNQWDIWVFPAKKPLFQPKDVYITSNVMEAIANLNKGVKVILLADKLGSFKNKTYAAFDPVFWSASWFPGQKTDVSGCLIRNNHPAMKQFPADEVADWQWKDVCIGSRGFVLNELPKEYFPIVEPVNDFHFGNKLGSVFELKTAHGGKLLVCGYNLTDDLDNRPATRQLRQSLFQYVESFDFNPSQEVNEEWLAKTFPDLNVPIIREKGFESAFVYIMAGAKLTDPGSVDWDKDMDGVIMEDGFNYQIDSDGVWSGDNGTFWFGKKIKIEFDVKSPKLMKLKLCFCDPENLGRKGVIKCEDMPEVVLDSHTPETWISIPVTRENCLDGKLSVEINCTTGPNLMLSRIALIP